MFEQWSSIESTSKALRIKDKPKTKHHKTREARNRELIDERAFNRLHFKTLWMRFSRLHEATMKEN